MNHRYQERYEYIEDLVRLIPLLLCSAQCLNAMMETHEGTFKSCPALHKLFSQTVAEMAIHSGRLLLTGCDHGSEVHELDSSMNFVKLCKIPECSRFHSVCQTPEGFAVTGGWGRDTCNMFVASTNSWKPLKSLSNPRGEHASIFFLGKIFVLGGCGLFVIDQFG